MKKISVIESSDYEYIKDHREEFDKILIYLNSFNNDYKLVIRFDDPKDELILQKGDWKE